MDTRPIISILTPTYNRAHTLETLKLSLDSQDCFCFEWVVVDDGSSDSTEALVRSWLQSVPYRIIYDKTVNGGKHRAVNRGITLASGDWTFIVDSDDWLPPDSMRSLSTAIAEARSIPSIGGIVGKKAFGDGSPITESFPAGLKKANSVVLRYRFGMKGDKAEVFKTDILRQFPFPVFEGEKFINEAVVWNRIAKAGWSLYLLDKVIYRCNYLPEGLSAASLALRIANPEGSLLFYREKLELPLGFKFKLRESINYSRFAIHSGRTPRMNSDFSGATKILVRLAVPFGSAAAIMDSIQLRRKRRIRGAR